MHNKEDMNTQYNGEWVSVEVDEEDGTITFINQEGEEVKIYATGDYNVKGN